MSVAVLDSSPENHWPEESNNLTASGGKQVDDLLDGFVGAVVGGFDSIDRPLCTRPPMPEYSEGLRVRMTPRWRRQSRANLSLEPKFPASRENTGNFIDSELSSASTRAKKAINSVP